MEETKKTRKPVKFTLNKWTGFAKDMKTAKKLFKQPFTVGAIEQGLKYAIEKKVEEENGGITNIGTNLTGNLTS